MRYNNNLKAMCLFFAAATFIIPALITSCSSGDYKKEISQIDSLIEIHHQTSLLLDQVDTLSAVRSRKLYADNWKSITEVIEKIEDIKLVRESEYWDYIMLYESKDRHLKKLMKRFFVMADRNKINDIQLTTFRKSLRKHQIPADSVQYYMDVESVAVYDVKREAETFVPEILLTKHVLDSLHAFSGEAVQYFMDIQSGEKNK